VTTTLADYEDLALKLARDPDALASLRDRLVRGRATAPLFDTARTARHVEAAYRQMVAQCGASPVGFAVADPDHP